MQLCLCYNKWRLIFGCVKDMNFLSIKLGCSYPQQQTIIPEVPFLANDMLPNKMHQFVYTM